MSPRDTVAPAASSLRRDRLDLLLAAAHRVRVAIVGDAMLDVYLHGDVERISPEAPVPVVRVRERRSALGGAANVAQNVVALGAQADLVCVVGRDASAGELRRMLGAIGADGPSLVDVDRATTTKTRVLARVQQVVRVDEEEDADLAGGDAERVVAAARRAIDRADALVLEDYNKGVLLPRIIEDVIAHARQRGIPVVVDPKYRNFFSYRGATVFKPNRRELEAALGAAVDLEHPQALPSALERLGVEHLLLTLGERGMVLAGRDGTLHRIPATAREVYDVVGAGDTVTAYLAAMLAAGASPHEAAEVANLAAGVEVGKLGAASVSADEVREAAARRDAAAGARTGA
ncbi:MAG TPA: D-glycero-beta-D-manno-heptose-7-phosphate kinase [Gemmatimonadaceae bacterium]|nr:D-glycero-beta-D-manno-heptose-7-phosphate kinase [Gemmatimonadaceae bacterium]